MNTPIASPQLRLLRASPTTQPGWRIRRSSLATGAVSLGEPYAPAGDQSLTDYANTLTQTAEYDQAQSVLEDLLRLRTAKGRPHANALLALSRNAEAAGKLKRAVPYAQRVYNVYRGYPELQLRPIG